MGDGRECFAKSKVTLTIELCGVKGETEFLIIDNDEKERKILLGCNGIRQFELIPDSNEELIVSRLNRREYEMYATEIARRMKSFVSQGTQTDYELFIDQKDEKNENLSKKKKVKKLLPSKPKQLNQIQLKVANFKRNLLI